MFKAFLTGLFLVLSSGSFALAQDYLKFNPTEPVTDLVGVFSSITTNRVNGALRSLKDQGGAQIAVLVINSLEGEEIEQASIKIVDKWKLGQKGVDRAVLLLIAYKDRRLRIEVGRGVEGELTDALSSRIINETIVPLMKADDFDAALMAGVYQIAKATDPQIDLSKQFEGVRRANRSRGFPADKIFIILFIIFILTRRIFGGGHGRSLLRFDKLQPLKPHQNHRLS
jgi:uncharacterized protein